MTDTDTDEAWTTADLANAIHAETPGGNAFVVRELTRRVAEQLPGVRRLDPGSMALDLSHALASMALVADTLISEWLGDLDEEEKPEGVATLAERLVECAKDFKAIGGSF